MMTQKGYTEEAPPDDLLEIGKVVKTWGLKGHVKVYSYAESIDTYNRVSRLYVQKRGGPEALRIETARQQNKTLLLKFEERDRIEDVEDLIGSTLYMPKKDLPPLEEGEYYWYELIGMKVRTDLGKQLGTLREILNTGSNDVYIVRQGSRELLIPALNEVILEVDVTGKQMVIHPMEGLLDENDI